MELVRRLLEINHDVILFAYGLVFFVMGLAIALQSRRYSRLDLARSLSWLGAFGLLHGLHEWGDFFIPLQAAYLSPPAIEFLRALHLFLLALSYGCLCEFAVALLHPLGRARWLHSAWIALPLLWVFVSFFVLLPLSGDMDTWRNLANALARYGIGFPGALLAAYGLRQQTLQRIAPLGVPHIVKALRLAGYMIVLYAIFGGLIPPPVPFFPGNWLNTTTFEQVVGVPPFMFRTVLGLVMAITIIRTLEVFDLETARMIESMEQQQILATERDRIGRELHDGAIQTVYTAGLLVESAYKLAPPDSQLASRLGTAVNVLNTAIGDLRRSLGELRQEASGEPLPDALRRLATDPRFSSFVDVSLDVDLCKGEAMSPVRTDHVLAVVGEALSNAIRHARAKHVRITAWCEDEHLKVQVRDDGQGISRHLRAGYGLRNMRDRARLLGGRLDVADASGVAFDAAPVAAPGVARGAAPGAAPIVARGSTNGRGTSVTLDIPWKDER